MAVRIARLPSSSLVSRQLTSTRMVLCASPTVMAGELGRVARVATCAQVALRHQGIVLQPSFLVGADLLAGTLVEVMPQWRSIELGVYAIYPSRKLVSPKARLMIEFLVNAFTMRGWPA